MTNKTLPVMALRGICSLIHAIIHRPTKYSGFTWTCPPFWSLYFSLGEILKYLKMSEDFGLLLLQNILLEKKVALFFPTSPA